MKGWPGLLPWVFLLVNPSCGCEDTPDYAIELLHVEGLGGSEPSAIVAGKLSRLHGLYQSGYGSGFMSAVSSPLLI